jgi:hypothetical protein
MRRSPQIFRPRATSVGKRRIACTLLFAYLVLLLQPCAMAMDAGATQHGKQCHQELVYPGDAGCLSQPVAECATDDTIIDERGVSIADVDLQLVALLPLDSADLAGPSVAQLNYHCRAPPKAGPALNIQYCVYLK